MQETLASSSTYSPTDNIVAKCLLDTGCLFANFAKADIARRLGPHTQSADKQRLITLADGSLTSSVGYVMCDVTLTHDATSMKIENVTLHILPTGPSIRCYNRLPQHKKTQPNYDFLLSLQREQLEGAKLH